MGVLYIAIGNPLRGDDGVAHRVLELLGPGVTKLGVQQLTPELACEVAQAETVVFIDADVLAGEPRLQPVGEPHATPLGHAMTPEEVVYLAKRLYGFAGEAFVCRVPAREFEGEELSLEAERNAHVSTALVNACYDQR
jgi:Ni,Fe-hydrogenase maturation factor